MNTAVLTKRGAIRARSGHPWIYRSDVADRAGNLLGTAFYNPGTIRRAAAG